MIRFKKIFGVILSGITAVLSAYDVKTVELVPVKFEKAPSHAPVKMVENGKLKVLNVKRRSRPCLPLWGRWQPEGLTEEVQQSPSTYAPPSLLRLYKPCHCEARRAV